MDPRRRNPRGSGAALRGEIIDAAITVVDSTNDASALTLRGVARQAGITAPSIYSHFADVQVMTDAVLAHSFSQLAGQVGEALAGKPEPVAALIAACSAYVRFGWEHKARYRLMFAADGFAPNAVETFTMVEKCISRCVEDGVSASSDPHADAFLVWVAMHGIATLDKPARSELLRLGPIDRPAVVHELVRRLARLADPGPAEPRRGRRQPPSMSSGSRT